jgi:hypothetical protein
MRLRSSGLGTTELEAEVMRIKKFDDLVVFSVNTTKPVKWRVRLGFQEIDLRALIRAIMAPNNLRFVVTGLLSPNKKTERTKDFWKEALKNEV